MALTRCVVGNEAFVCDVSLIEGKIIIHNIHKDLLLEVRLIDIVDVYREGDALIIKTSFGELLLSTSGTSPLISNIGRSLELKIRYDEFSPILKDVLLHVAKAYQTIGRVVKEFHEDYVSRWVSSPQHIKDLYLISNNLRRYGIDVKRYVDVLSRSFEGRSVSGVKEAIKDLILNMTRLVEEYLRTLLMFEDLTPLLNMVVLAYVIEVAGITNQPLEVRRAEEDLLRTCISDIYVKMLDTPEVDICRNLVEDLKQGAPYEAISKFLENYLKALKGDIKRLLNSY